MRIGVCGAAVAAVSLVPAAVASGGDLSFRVGFDAALQPGPYSGSVYVVMTQGGRGEPRLSMGNWFAPSPMFAVDVAGVPAGGAVEVGAGALWFPVEMAEVPAGTYRVQAVARR